MELLSISLLATGFVVSFFGIGTLVSDASSPVASSGLLHDPSTIRDTLAVAGATELRCKAKIFIERSEMHFESEMTDERALSWRTFERIIVDVIESGQHGNELFALSAFLDLDGFKSTRFDEDFFCVLAIKMSAYLPMNVFGYEGLCQNPRREHYARMIDLAKKSGLSSREIIRAYTRFDDWRMEELLSTEFFPLHTLELLLRTDAICQRGVDYLDRFIDAVSHPLVRRGRGTGFREALDTACTIGLEEAEMYKDRFILLSECLEAVLMTQRNTITLHVIEIPVKTFLSETFAGWARFLETQLVRMRSSASFRFREGLKGRIPRYGFPESLKMKLHTLILLPCIDEGHKEHLLNATLQVVDQKNINMIALADLLDFDTDFIDSVPDLQAVFATAVGFFVNFGVDLFENTSIFPDIADRTLIGNIINAWNVLGMDIHEVPVKLLNESVDRLQEAYSLLSKMADQKLLLLSRGLGDSRALIHPGDSIDDLINRPNSKFTNFLKNNYPPLDLTTTPLRHRLPTNVLLLISEFISSYPTAFVLASLRVSPLFPSPALLLRTALRRRVLDYTDEETQLQIERAVLSFVNLVYEIERRVRTNKRKGIHEAVHNLCSQLLRLIENENCWPRCRPDQVKFKVGDIDRAIQTFTQKIVSEYSIPSDSRAISCAECTDTDIIVSKSALES